MAQPGCGVGLPPAKLVMSYLMSPTLTPQLVHPPTWHVLSPGFVAVTHILAYLEAMTGRSPQDTRLQTLAHSLDPNGEGPQATVDLHTFLVIMRDWIAACQLDGWVLVPPLSPGSPS